VVGLECGRCSLVWNVNEQSSGSRFRSGRCRTTQDRRGAARFTTHGYVVAPRSSLERGTPRARARAVRRFTCRRFLRTGTGSGGREGTRGTRGKPDGCQGHERKTRAGPVLVSRGHRRPRRAVVVVAISNGSGEQAALLVPVMHARQAPSGVFIIAPRLLVPAAKEERERTASRWRRWRHRCRRIFDTAEVGERERETARNEKERRRGSLSAGE